MYAVFLGIMMRFQRVDREEKVMIVKIEQLCTEDLMQGFQWSWRLDDYLKQRSFAMVWKFWKPPLHVFKDKRFLDPQVKLMKRNTQLA